MRAARMACTVTGIWISLSDRVALISPLRTSALSSNSACTISSIKKGLPSVLLMMRRFSGTRSLPSPRIAASICCALSRPSGSSRACCAPGLHSPLQRSELGAGGIKIWKLTVAIALQRLIHERAVVIGIKAAERKRKALGDGADSFNHQALFAHRKGRAFCPAAVNVGQGQRVNEVPAFLRAAAVFDHIALEKSRRRIAPIGEGPHRHALSNRRARAPAAPPRASGRFAFRAEQSIDRGGADIQEPASYHRSEREMAVALHRVDEHRNEYPKPLAADAIAGLPQDRQCLMYRLVVQAPPPSAALHCQRLIQHAQRVFAMIPGYPDELGQDLPPLPPRDCRLIPFPDRVLKVSACRHAQLPRHLLHHPAAAPLLGSSLREATGTAPITKIVSQCVDKNN